MKNIKNDLNKLNNLIKSKSLQKLEIRYNKAIKFKYNISMSDIQLTKDVKNFINIIPYKLNQSQTSLIYQN